MTHNSPAPSRGERSRLVALGSVPGFRLAPGEPDIRGWSLLANSGAELGTVNEILIDPATDEVRALVIATAPSSSSASSQVVFPIEHVALDERRRVLTTELAPDAFHTSPARDRSATHEEAAPREAPATHQAAAMTSPTIERTADGDQIIKVPIVEEELVVERRPVVKEVVVIRKRAVQGTQTVEADLRKERLDIERR